MSVPVFRCFVSFLLLSTWSLLASADLPVHCLRHQVVGAWDFHLGPSGSSRSACGHRRPDTPDAQPPSSFISELGDTRTLQVTLRDPASASDSEGRTGSWTMIYDEAFEVKLGDQVFLAFSSFEWVDDGENGRRNVSHCDATQVGWYRNEARTEWGCYVARKALSNFGSGVSTAGESPLLAGGAPSHTTGVAAVETAPRQLAAEDRPAAVPDSNADAGPDQNNLEAARSRPKASGRRSSSSQGFLERQEPPPPPPPEAQQSEEEEEAMSGDSSSEPSPSSLAGALNEISLSELPASYKAWTPNSTGFDHPMAGHWQESVAQALNFMQLGWSAAAYSFFEGKTPRELNRFAGVRRHLPGQKPQRPGQAGAASAAPPTLLSVAEHSQVEESEDFDWRRRHGHNWMTPVVNQGDCGSCYTISTVHMLTVRHRIQKQDPSLAQFSVSFPLYCSEYNQGCDGGYGFLQSKWSEDIGLVPESCSPFSTGGGSCQALKGCDLGEVRFRAINHHYVGGYYGGSEEHLIKEELMANGPVVMSFEPREDFMYYKSGVYKSGAHKIHQEWEQVDHAVLLVGYGKDDDTAYWTMQNSWGDDWGEDGYFRMARGQDESGCESIVVAAEVIEESSNPVLDEFLASLS